MLEEQILSDVVLRTCLQLHQEVGPGLLENVYKNGLYNKFKNQGRMVAGEKNYRVFNDGALLGDYYADLVLENKIIIEVKSTLRLSYSMEAQLLNYLHISGIKVGYLVNFKHACLDWKRLVV